MLEAGCGAPPTPEVKAAVERAARDFEAAGAHVEPLEPFLTQDMLDGLDHFWRTRALDRHQRACARASARAVLPFIRDWAESADGFSGVACVPRLRARFRRCARPRSTATAGFDFVLSPTAPMTAFPAEWASPSRDPLNPFPHIGFTVAFNMSEQPAASVNCGYDDEGLPIGLQIIGRRFDDLGVLAVARAFEAMRACEARPWPEPPDTTASNATAVCRAGSAPGASLGWPSGNRRLPCQCASYPGASYPGASTRRQSHDGPNRGLG